MEVTLRRPFAANTAVDENDVRQIKKALNRLGYYQPNTKTGITEIPDAAVFDSLKKFQFDFGLRPAGTAKPDDETIHSLNREIKKTPLGKYIWRTVGDGKVRSAHAALNGTVRSWDDNPDPGEDYNCRCWAEHMLNEFGTSDVDAISPTIGPFDLLAGGLAARGGLRVALTTVQTLRQILTRGPKLNATQELNLSRFISKIPANSKNTVEITKLRNGNIKFKANSPGKSHGSRAVYEKTIDPEGKTIDYRKTIYDKRNNIIHTKNKFNERK